MADRYAVIGNPVAHSKSPEIHRAFARATGQDIEYLRIEAPLDSFAATLEAFRGAGGKGANVTLPFKTQALAYCAGRVSERALKAAAVNTLSFADGACSGDNTDGIGLVRDLTQNLGIDLKGKRVLLMGAGGAAQGVVQPLLDSGVASLVIVNRTAARAHELAQRFAGVRGCGYADLAGAFDVLLNATSAGLQGELPALPAASFAPGAFAYDMVYGRETPFMAFARQRGARVSDGIGMLVEQAAESFRIWRGVSPETAPVLAELKQRLNPAEAAVPMKRLRPFLLAWKAFCYGIGTLLLIGVLIQAWFFSQVLWYKWFNPSSTAFMEARLETLRAKDPKARLRQTWVPYERISNSLKRSVVAAEDAKFLDHEGFDWEAIQKAMEKNERRGKVVAGASTISQQLAKNLFLSGDRSYLRKGQEAVITWMLETILPKRRILELYLNVAEWGDGIFGAEAAAQHHFGVPAASLGPSQAAWLASILPSPRRYDRGRITGYIAGRVATIQARMGAAQIP